MSDATVPSAEPASPSDPEPGTAPLASPATDAATGAQPGARTPIEDAGDGAGPGAAAPYRLRWVVFVAVVTANVMDLVDVTVMNVAAPTIRAELGGGQPMLQWLGAGYTLAFATFLITGARLGDLFGRRRLFLIGAAGFTGSSLLCALAWSPEMLIGSRVLQGGFGALMIPQGFAMLTEVLKGKDMERGFAVFGPIMGLSAIAGPIIGAALLEADVLGTGWRAIFVINLPLGLFVLVAGARAMPRSVAVKGGGLDLLGMGLVGLAMVLLIFPLIEGHEQGWPAWSFGLMAGGVVVAAIFVARLRRTPPDRALIRLSLLQNSAFSSGMLVAAGFFSAFAGMALVLGLFWQVGEGDSPTEAAIALVPITLGMVVGMVGGFALVERLGRKLVQLGLAIAAAGLVILAATAQGQPTLSAWAAVPGTVLMGAGSGLVFGQLFDVILASVDEVEVGSASGLLNALQQFGNALGVAVVGTVFLNVLDVPHLPTDALAITALACLIPLAASFVLAFRLPPRAREGGPVH